MQRYYHSLSEKWQIQLTLTQLFNPLSLHGRLVEMLGSPVTQCGVEKRTGGFNRLKHDADH